MNVKPWLVALAVGTVVDTATTLYAIEAYGLAAEANPVARATLGIGWWLFVAVKVAASAGLGALMSKGHVLLTGRIAITALCLVGASNTGLLYFRVAA